MNVLKDILKRLNAFTILVAILSGLLGWQLGHKDVDIKWANYRPSVNVENKTPPKNINVDFTLFWDTWDLLTRRYLDKSALDQQKLFYGAIQGMVAAVGDPYTVFLPPDDQKSSKEELGGSFEGVGIQLGFDKEKRLVVIAPLDGTPAARAGVKAGDFIVKIGDKSTLSITLPEAVNLIRGPKGTDINLTIVRAGEDQPRDIKLTRDTIIVKSVVLTMKQTKSGKGVGVVKLSRFGERTEEEWTEVISDLLSKAPQGVVLDLRNNPGGFLDGAVFIASEFLEGGDVVIQENNEGARFPYKVNREGKLLKLPVVVLINKGSASASEIVAGALQDRKRAKLVGEKSFGKGTIQEAEDLPGNVGIHITTARWLTPNGRWVNKTEGFEPDIKVEPSVDPLEDAQLDKALELLN
jgi:carboxyl-terminal processing protease